MPSGSTYGKYAKSIFEAPEDKLMAFADFSSLEDYISALQSKDPNKLKVYLGHEIFKLSYGTEEEIIRDDSTIRIGGDLFKVTELMEYCDNPEEIFPPDKQYDTLFRTNIDTMNQPIRLVKIGNSSGYDGHSVRAFSYFPQKLPGIVDTVESINSIKKLFDPIRGESKGPTFQLTYSGTKHGLMDKFGFTLYEAETIETNYHVLYEVSDKYKEARIQEASELGYMVLAFGLRIRCPLLSKTIRNSKHSARGASEDERTLGNAIGQSYGLLNNRAMVEFMEAVWASPYKHRIFPIAPIHDASYYIIDNDIDVVKFVNDYLIKAMQWQEDPLIAHDRVKIGAELDIAYPNWSKAVTIPNNASKEQIMQITDDYLEKLKADGEL